MECETMSKERLNVIGIIPCYPKHSQYNIYAGVRMPPVGIISVLTQIEHDDKIDSCYVVDENNYGGPLDVRGLPDHTFLQDRSPVQIAMFYGGMSNSIPRLFSVAKQYKKFGTVTIAGGSHVDALPREALDSGVDIVVHGEGEYTAKEILDAISGEGEINFAKLGSIKGISFMKDGEYVFTGKRKPIANLDKLRSPDLTLVKHLRKRWTAIPINRGRGCNFKCEFCVVNEQYGRFKTASVQRPLQEIIKYSDLGFKYFFFVDDNFAQNIPDTIELCEQIGNYKRKFKRKIQIMVQVRTEVAENDELIKAMKYAGVDSLAMGYESPIDAELKAMKKGVTVKKLVERSRKLSQHFYLHGMFIFGYPTEEKSLLTLQERAREYLRFFKRSKIDTIQIMNAVPLPGSELRDRLEREGKLLPLETVGWDKYDGLFLCYDPSPEDPYLLQNLPKLLMKKRYLGSFLSRNLNYGNWINFTYNSTIGFPIKFGLFYAKRFFYNLSRKRKESFVDGTAYFIEPLKSAWKGIKRDWRNLVVKTYGGVTMRRWLKEYKRSGFSAKLKARFKTSS